MSEFNLNEFKKCSITFRHCFINECSITFKDTDVLLMRSVLDGRTID